MPYAKKFICTGEDGAKYTLIEIERTTSNDAVMAGGQTGNIPFAFDYKLANGDWVNAISTDYQTFQTKQGLILRRDPE